VKPSGEIVDSTGEVVSTVPVYETVTTDGLPWRNIIIGVVLLLLIAVVVISMLKRKQRLVSSVDDSSSKV
jgi:short subunit fatty acids transporter